MSFFQKSIAGKSLKTVTNSRPGRLQSIFSTKILKTSQPSWTSTELVGEMGFTIIIIVIAFFFRKVPYFRLRMCFRKDCLYVEIKTS